MGRVGADEKGIAVWLRLRDVRCRDRPVGTGPVVNHDRLRHRFSQLLSDEPGSDVAAAARAEGNDNGDGTAGVGLLGSGKRCQAAPYDTNSCCKNNFLHLCLLFYQTAKEGGTFTLPVQTTPSTRSCSTSSLGNPSQSVYTALLSSPSRRLGTIASGSLPP